MPDLIRRFKLSATFTIGDGSCIRIGNTFNLYLVNPGGNEINIGSYNGFYSTFVNGLIPAGTPAGTGYKVRIKSSNPALVSDLSIPFEIRAGTPVTAGLSSVASTISNNPVTFGSCNSANNTDFNLTNVSGTNQVTATINNELNPGAPVVLTYSAATTTNVFKANQAHYTIFVKATTPDGTVATQAYFLINNLAVTAFTTTSSNTVCYPIGSFEYGVEVNQQTGIAANFPGNTYRIDWGDGKSDEYTFVISNPITIRYSILSPNHPADLLIQQAIVLLIMLSESMSVFTVLIAERSARLFLQQQG